MSDTLLPGLLKKIQELSKYANDPNNERNSIIAKIAKVEQWLVGDRSLQEHRCCFGFLTFLYNSYGEEFNNFDDFRYWLYCRCGMAYSKVTEYEKDGKITVYHKYMVKSLAFGVCSQRDFHEFFTNLQNFAYKMWGVVFDDWKQEYDQNEHLI